MSINNPQERSIIMAEQDKKEKKENSEGFFRKVGSSLKRGAGWLLGGAAAGTGITYYIMRPDAVVDLPTE